VTVRALALSAALVSFAGATASARPATKHKPAAHAAAPARKAPPPSTAKERTPSATTAPESKNGGASGAGSDDSGGDDSSSGGDAPAATTASTGGKKVTSKTYTFGAMDVEGKLKTPQLLYFLNRVKLELDMSAPDKRSFMKELQQSADDKNL
jgi:hypothetical protein